ncbi:MAG: hypothetical protein ABR551_09120 [Gemmatimonadales bacterium]
MIPLLLLLAAGWVPYQHHHADHDGHQIHVDEAHGSHSGTAWSEESERLPAGGRLVLPLPLIIAAAIPAFNDQGVRVPTVALVPTRYLGRGPPRAHPSRAPPISQR